MLLLSMVEALLRGAVVLTPNQRSARGLREAFDKACREAGMRSWNAGAVLPWGAWTSAVWMKAIVCGWDSRVLLNGLQEQSLWREILREDAALPEERTRALAGLCAEAERLLHEYRGWTRLRDWTGVTSSDVETFRRCLAGMEARCSREQLLPRAALNTALSDLLRDRSSDEPLPGEILLFGFDALLPSQEELIQAIRTAGTRVEVIDAYSSVSATPPVLVAASDGEAELQACARSIQVRLKENRSSSVLLVVPDLREHVAAVERVLRAEVAPETQDIESASGAKPWHIAEGKPLSELTLTRDALQMLRWCVSPLPLNAVSGLLLSPYTQLAASPEEGAEADAFGVRKSRLTNPELSLSAAAKLLQDRHAGIARRLHDMAGEARGLRGSGGFASWAERARALLRAAGWPGARERNSVEHQVIARWEEMLDRVATLDLLHAGTTFAGFLEVVDDLAAETLFAPENTGDAVQVMTVAEAAGSTADLLWFLHADEGTWSSRRRAHPLLPWRLQRELRMPGTNAENDRALGRVRTERLARSAAEVRFSFAEAGRDGPQRASSLVLQLAGLTRQEAGTTIEEAEPLSPMEEGDDTAPLPALPDRVLVGGIGVLQTQAACGFRAFAEKRLFSTDIPERQPGLQPRDRGDLLHRALELFWKRVRSQAELIESTRERVGDESKRDHLLNVSIDEAFGSEPLQQWEVAYIAVQKRRLFLLLRHWLDYEATRPAFEVLGVEHGVADARVGPLRLNLRVDRMDRVLTDAGSATVLIDYKTGTVHPNRWEGDRPEEPQLPAYAVAADVDDIGAIAFASIRAGEKNSSMAGWPLRSPLLPKSRLQGEPMQMEEHLVEWRRVIDALARQFAEGDAAVHPKKFPKTCTHCGQRSLCRLDPATLREVVDEDSPEWVEGGWSA